MTRIQLRRDTALAWLTNAPTLAAAELGVETDTGSIKVGDGVTEWQYLAYAGAAQRRKSGFFIVTDDFGAVANGVHDDQPAFMAAITAAVENGGGTIVVPPGDYALGAPIAPVNMGTITDGAAENVRLIGVGYRGLSGLEPGGARLLSKGAWEVIGGWWNACEISNLCMDVQGFNAPAIRADISKCLISHNEVMGWVGYGMQLCTDVWKQNGDPTYLNKIEYNHIQQQGGIGLFASYLMWDSTIRFNNIGSTDANIMTEGGPHKIHYNWLDGETGPKHNIHMANVGHTTEIIGNYMENCQRESILIERPDWEIGDRRLSFKIIGNQILNGGHDSNGSFPAVRILGNEPPDTGKLVGLIFNNNQFFDDESGHWTHAIQLRNIRSATISGNDWSNNAYTSAESILLEDCEDIQISANAGSPSSPPLSYEHAQVEPAATWTVTHTLERYPLSCEIIVGGELVFSDIALPDTSTVVVTFASPQAGILRLT